DAELTPFADNYRHVTEKACDGPDVEGRGHDKNAQLRADEALRRERECEPEVGVQAALVELIEDEQTDALQRGIVLEQPRQHSFRDDLEARRPADACVEPHAISDRPSNRLA